MKQYLLMFIAVTFMRLPATAGQLADSTSVATGFKFKAIVETQVQKDLWDEFGDSTTRFTSNMINGYQEAVEDFFMRVSLIGSYRLNNLEGVFNLRFYPYWTLQRQIPNAGSAPDLASYLDLIEINQAYIKTFKEYTPHKDLTFEPWFKAGRDQIQNSCGQIFGNYLDQPVGGYNYSAVPDTSNITPTGPLWNRMVFANEIEAGFSFNVYNMVGGRTSVMIGGNVSDGNVNNNGLYEAFNFYQSLDSKLSAGFYRIYQDFYFLNSRIHIGGGVRDYSTTVDTGILAKFDFFSAQGAFDAVIMKDMKIYTEMAMQRQPPEPNLGISTESIIRPINAGLTIPTFGVADTLAVEFENIGKTYFSNQSMRAQVGPRTGSSMALAWGFVVQKKFWDRVNLGWGLYTADNYGDLASILRLSTYF
jgi:hypothetical protein